MGRWGGHTAVEGVGFGVLLGELGGGVGGGVGDAGGLALLGGQAGVEGVYEEGGSGGEEDVAVVGVSLGVGFLV